MKKLLLISLLLTMTTTMFGQTVSFYANPEKPCEGDNVTFHAEINLLGDRTYQLYRGFQRLEAITSQSNTATFSPLIAEPGRYYVRVLWGGRNDTISESINVYAATSEFSETICQGESYHWNNQEYFRPGDYTQTFTGSNGCDSLVTLHLSMLDVIQTELYETTCEGVPYQWNQQEYTQSGDYTVFFPSAQGCDSIVTLHLTVNPPLSSTEEVAICQGDIFTWNGVDYSESGTYTKTFSNPNGCDSIATLVLTVEAGGEVTIQGENQICHNKSARYSAVVGSHTSCEWEVEGGVITNGENTSTITVLWNDANTGKVLLTVKKDDSNCVFTDVMDVTVNSYVGELNGIHVKKTADGLPYMLIYKNPEEGFKYQWYLNDVAIKEANGQYYMKEEGLDAGVYKVYVSFNQDAEGLFCGKFSETVEINAAERTPAIYPNPNTEGNNLMVRGVERNSLVSIYTVDGRMVFQKHIDGDGILPVQLKQGCYFVEILDADQNKLVEKLIIK